MDQHSNPQSPFFEALKDMLGMDGHGLFMAIGLDDLTNGRLHVDGISGCPGCSSLYYGNCQMPSVQKLRKAVTSVELDTLRAAFDEAAEKQDPELFARIRADCWAHQSEEVYKLGFEARIDDIMEWLVPLTQELVKSQAGNYTAAVVSMGMQRAVEEMLRNPEFQAQAGSFFRKWLSQSGLADAIGRSVAGNLREWEREKYEARWYRRLGRWYTANRMYFIHYWGAWADAHGIDMRTIALLTEWDYPGPLGAFLRSRLDIASYRGWRAAHQGLPGLMNGSIRSLENVLAASRSDFKKEQAAERSRRMENARPAIVRWITGQHDETTLSMIYALTDEEREQLFLEESRKHWELVLVKYYSEGNELEPWEWEIYNRIPEDEERILLKQLVVDGKIVLDPVKTAYWKVLILKEYSDMTSEFEEEEYWDINESIEAVLTNEMVAAGYLIPVDDGDDFCVTEKGSAWLQQQTAGAAEAEAGQPEEAATDDQIPPEDSVDITE